MVRFPLLMHCQWQCLIFFFFMAFKIFYVQVPYWYPCTVSESSLLVFTRASLRAIVRQSYSQAQCQWQGKRYYTGRPLRNILLHTMSDRCPGGNELAVTGTLLANGTHGYYPGDHLTCTVLGRVLRPLAVPVKIQSFPPSFFFETK